MKTSSTSKTQRITRAQAIRDLFSPVTSLQGRTKGTIPGISTPELLDAYGLAKASASANQGKSKVKITARDSISEAIASAQAGVHPTILIFGSARRAGGGWDKGATAQEEDVALHSTWGLQAEMIPAYYDVSKSETATAMNPDLLLWADTGLVLANDLNNWLHVPIPCTFVAFAAPNAAGLSSSGVNVDNAVVQRQIRDAMEVRCMATLALAQQKDTEHLILGAIGCGVFKLNPQMVAQTWARAIKATGYAGAVTFALPSGPGSVIGIAFQEAFDTQFEVQVDA